MARSAFSRDFSSPRFSRSSGFAARDSSPGMPPFLAPFFGVASIVIFPILFAVFGAIGGGLGAVIYNVAARFVGGIEVEVE